MTIGLDLGDRWSSYCVLEEAGKIIVQQKVPATREALTQTFESAVSSLWRRNIFFMVSRLSTELPECGWEDCDRGGLAE